MKKRSRRMIGGAAVLPRGRKQPPSAFVLSSVLLEPRQTLCNHGIRIGPSGEACLALPSQVDSRHGKKRDRSRTRGSEPIAVKGARLGTSGKSFTQISAVAIESEPDEDAPCRSRHTLTEQEESLVMQHAQFEKLAQAELGKFPLPNHQRDPDSTISSLSQDDIELRTCCMFFIRKVVRFGHKFPFSDDLCRYVVARSQGPRRQQLKLARACLKSLADDGVLMCETTQSGGVFLVPTDWMKLSADPHLRDAVTTFKRRSNEPALLAPPVPLGLPVVPVPPPNTTADAVLSVLEPPPCSDAALNARTHTAAATASGILGRAPTSTVDTATSPTSPSPTEAASLFPLPVSPARPHVRGQLAGAPFPPPSQTSTAIPAYFKANETPEILRWRWFWAREQVRARWDAALRHRRANDASELDAAPAAPAIGQMSSVLFEGAEGSLAGDVDEDVAQLVAYLADTCPSSLIHSVSVGIRNVAANHDSTGYGVRGIGHAVLLLKAQLGTAAEAESLRAAMPKSMRVETAVGEALATATLTIRGRSLDHIPNDAIATVVESFGPCRAVRVEDAPAPTAPYSPTVVQAPAAFLNTQDAQDRTNREGSAEEKMTEVVAVTFTDPQHGAADCRTCLKAVQFHMAVEWRCVVSMASPIVERVALGQNL